MINWKALSRFLGISRPDYNLLKKELEQELDVQSTADGDVLVLTDILPNQYITASHMTDQLGIKPRPSWDEVWMRMAEVLAERSIDPRTKVGVLIVSGDNTRVLANGYNGLERGGSNVVESLEPGKSGCLHGEENALIKMDYSFSGRKVLYTTVACCDMCAKRVINGNVDEVVYRDAYRDMSGIERLKAAGIKVRQFKP